MSLETPTTKEIADNIIAQLEAELNQTIPLLQKSFMRVMSKAFAGVFVLLYKYGGFIFLQMFVRTASAQETTVLGVPVTPLLFWGRLVGVGDPTPATQAELLIDITVESQGGTLAAGSQLTNSSNGVIYITIGSVLLNSATVQATIRAVSDPSGEGGAGTIGNLNPGDIVSFVNPLDAVARDAVVDSQVVTGANPESIEVYRQRVIDRFQKPPQGGAYADYEAWAEEVPGIINAYPYTGDPGIVNVYSEATPESSGSEDGIPTQAQLDAVKASIEFDISGLASRRPVGAFVNSLAITRSDFSIDVEGISGVNDLGVVQADITQALEEYFWDAEPYIIGLSVPPRKDKITNTRITSIVEDIVTAAGGTFTRTTFTLVAGGGDLTDYALGEGEKTKAEFINYF